MLRRCAFSNIIWDFQVLQSPSARLTTECPLRGVSRFLLGAAYRVVHFCVNLCFPEERRESQWSPGRLLLEPWRSVSVLSFGSWGFPICSFEGCLKREPWALETIFLFGAQGFLGTITNEKASHELEEGNLFVLKLSGKAISPCFFCRQTLRNVGLSASLFPAPGTE